MTDLTVNFKNVPPIIAGMFEVAFQTVPAHIGEPSVEIPADGLTIDFQKCKDQDLANDLIGAMHILVMAHSWIALKQRENEHKGH
jgi:hypothetical protein